MTVEVQKFTCPRCHAKVGEPCRNTRGQVVAVHDERRTKANKARRLPG